MTNYQFDPVMADNARDQMAAITKRINAELENLHNNVMSSIQEWEGDDRNTYIEAERQWNAAADRMPASLAKAEQVLANISNGYLKIEHTGVNQWGGYSVK